MIALSKFYEQVAHLAGHVLAAPLAVLLMAVLNFMMGIDATNLAISIASIVLLFIIQSSQNRDGLAIQTKLDELIRSSSARNDFVGIDKKPEDEIKGMRHG